MQQSMRYQAGSTRRSSLSSSCVITDIVGAVGNAIIGATNNVGNVGDTFGDYQGVRESHAGQETSFAIVA